MRRWECISVYRCRRGGRAGPSSAPRSAPSTRCPHRGRCLRGKRGSAPSCICTVGHQDGHGCSRKSIEGRRCGGGGTYQAHRLLQYIAVATVCCAAAAIRCVNAAITVASPIVFLTGVEVLFAMVPCPFTTKLGASVLILGRIGRAVVQHNQRPCRAQKALETPAGLLCRVRVVAAAPFQAHASLHEVS
jgi:hypothetical protein